MYKHYFLNLKSVIWGYRKPQVDEYFKDLFYKNYNELSELSFRILLLEGEKKQLEMTSLNLKRDLMSFSTENLFVNLLVETLETKDRHKKVQSAKVIVRKTADKAAITKTIDGAVDIIKQEFGVLSGKVDTLVEMIGNKNIVQSNSVEISKIEPTVSNEIRFTSLTSIAEANKNSTMNEKGKVEAVDFTNEAVNSKKLDMEIHTSDMGKILNFSRINTAPIKKEIIRKQKDSFWGIAVNEYQKSAFADFGINTQEVLEYANKTDEILQYNSFFDKASRSVKNQKVVRKEIKFNEEIAATVEGKNSSTAEFQQTDRNVSDSNKEIQKQVEVDEDARYIRQKYIVGKTAGEDLYDRNRKLIIGRKSKITSQVVDYADREGKLPELIINMILSDTE